MWNADTGVGYGAEGLGMSSLLLDWLHRTGMLAAANAPTPPAAGALRGTPAVGSARDGTAFDDAWWANATGANCAVDRLELREGTGTPGGVARKVKAGVQSLTVLYGDRRAAVGASDASCLVSHGSGAGGGGGAPVAAVTAALPAVVALDIPRDVGVASVHVCGGLVGVAYLRVTLTDGQTAAVGDAAATGGCQTLTPPSGSNGTLAGVHGRAQEAAGGRLCALGLWWL
jgi:hypothetical protein